MKRLLHLAFDPSSLFPLFQPALKIRLHTVEMDPFVDANRSLVYSWYVGTSAKAAKLLHYIRSKYKNVGLTIASMATDCVKMQATLYQIESLIEQDLELYASHLEGKSGLKSTLDWTPPPVLEVELDKLEDELTRQGKGQCLWNESPDPRPLVADSQSIFSNKFSHDSNPGRSLLLFGLEG